ncbi:MAG: fibronectin type III domain-containing protein [Lachnospiraceae bacterium]|nr:fibronectin type III domain-containing protein [Lachnospiraceae bacterium]
MIRSTIKRLSAYLLCGAMLFGSEPIIKKVNAAPSMMDTEVTSENILAVEKKYDPDGAHVLETTVARGNDFMVWFGKDKNILRNMNSAVHESFHQISNVVGEYDCENYYIGGGRADIKVAFTETFTSDAIYPSIPQELKDISHAKRGRKYLGEGSEPNMSSIKRGAYGILQEYAAYVRGARTDVNLITYVETQKADWETIEDYIGEIANDVESEAEFTYFLLHYLAYAKTNNPSVYAGIMANESFKQAVKAVADMAHENQVAIGTDILPRMVKFFEKSGYKAYYNDEYFGIMYPKLIKNADGTNTSGGSIGLYYDSYYRYMEEVNKEPYVSLAKELGMDITYSRIKQMEDIHNLYMYDADGNIITKEEYQKQLKEQNESSTFTLSGPKKITAKNVSKGIKVTWQTVKNAERYEIHRFDEKLKNEKVVGTVKDPKATTFIDTSAKAGKGYTYQIFVYATPPFKNAKEVHASGANSELIVRLKAPTLKSLKAAKKKLTVKYAKVTGATGYNIQYSTDKNFKNKKSVNVNKATTLKKALTNLASKKKYYVRVRAINKTYVGYTFYSVWSSVKNIKVK